MPGRLTARARGWVRRHWPQLRLRTIVFVTLFAVAAMPGIGAVGLRVYENTLVRQTGAELAAQAAALAATAQTLWPGGGGSGPVTSASQNSDIDLSTTPIRGERPAPTAAPPPTQDAIAAAARLDPIVTQTRRATLASIILLDASGRIVAGSGGTGSYAALPEVAAALHGHPMTVLRRNGAYRATYRFEWLSRAAAIRVDYVQPIVVRGRVVGVLLLSRSARALFKGLYEDRGKIAFGVVAIFALLVILSGLVSRGVTRPIERLGRATRAVASGHGEMPEAPRTAAIEIQGLYADFTAMAAAIDRRSRYLRDFAYAVSHEFKTPLAGIRGAIELLQDHPDMAATDRQRFLNNADADAERLSRLVSRLLDLARADMSEAGGETTPDPAGLIRRFATTSTSDTLTVDAAPSPLPPVAAPPTTIEAVLTTLIDNSGQAGAHRVTISADASGDRIAITVTDDGPGLVPADAARLFEPFFTTRRAEGGSGLGLAIARSLIEGAGGTLTLATMQPASFTLRIPRA